MTRNRLHREHEVKTKNGMRRPCKECPFAKSTPPDKGQKFDSLQYVGQIRGPFWLPCHMSKGYEENRLDHERHEQCAGAAMHRDLVGVAGRMPDQLLKLEGDEQVVFKTHEEFVAHHEQVPIDVAQMGFRLAASPDDLMKLEMMRIQMGEGFFKEIDADVPSE